MKCLLKIAFIGSLFVHITLGLAIAEPETYATEQEIEQVTQEVSETAMSPFCPGRTISACPSGQARELRNQIKRWFQQGYSRQGVMNHLINTYGEEVRGTPRAEGFGLAAWIVPALFVLLSTLFVILLLKSLGAKDLSEPEAPEPLEPEMLDQIESELEKRR